VCVCAPCLPTCTTHQATAANTHSKRTVCQMLRLDNHAPTMQIVDLHLSAPVKQPYHVLLLLGWLTLLQITVAAGLGRN
jgi:hypothetical protein